MAHPQEAQVGAAGGCPWFSDGSGIEWGLCPKTGRVRFHAACQVVENVTTAYPFFLANLTEHSSNAEPNFSISFFISHRSLHPGIFNDVWTLRILRLLVCVDRPKHMWHATKARSRSASPCHAAPETCGRGLKF